MKLYFKILLTIILIIVMFLIPIGIGVGITYLCIFSMWFGWLWVVVLPLIICLEIKFGKTIYYLYY